MSSSVLLVSVSSAFDKTRGTISNTNNCTNRKEINKKKINNLFIQNCTYLNCYLLYSD